MLTTILYTFIYFILFYCFKMTKLEALACSLIWSCRSHNAAIGMNIIFAEKVNCIIINSTVGLVWKIPMHAFVETVPVVVIGSCIGTFIQVLRCVRIIFTVVGEWPELCPSSCSPHNLEDLSLVHISCYCHPLLIHVYLQAIHTCKMLS